jgi:hypothetical protein
LRAGVQRICNTVQGGAVVRRSKTRRLVFPVLAVAALAGSCAFVAAQMGPSTPPPKPGPAAPANLPSPGGGAPATPPEEPLHLVRDLPGDSKPIILHADDITTWVEGGKRVVLLQGQVLVQQAVVQCRFQQGVVWVDLERFQRSRILHVEVYAEGEVQLENGSGKGTGPKAFLELNTRGEFKLNAHKNKVVQQAHPEDPLYKRAQAEKTPPSPIQRTSLTEPAAPTAGPKTVPVQGQPPPPGPAGPPAPSPPPTFVIPVPGPPPNTSGSPTPNPGLGVPFPPAPGGPPPPQGGAPGTSALPPQSAPGPPAPGAEETAPPPRALGPNPAAPEGPVLPRAFSIRPRTGSDYQSQIIDTADGQQAMVLTGGIILMVNNVDKVGLLDLEADRAVIWSRGGSRLLLENLRKPEGGTSRELEVYLAGNVVLRQQDLPKLPPPPPVPGMPLPPPHLPHKRDVTTRTLRADELYYDVNRNVAIALKADLEVLAPTSPDALHFTGVEVQQLSPTQFRAIKADLFNSKLPSDPGLDVSFSEATLEEQKIPRRTLWGSPVLDIHGQQEIESRSIVDGRNVFFDIEGVPFFYLPWAKFNARNPLGPLENLNLGYNRIFGFQAGVTLNMYDLLGLDPLPGSHWRMDVDVLSSRGPGLGTEFESHTPTFFGLPAHNDLFLKAWGIIDDGTDNLGGGRGPDDNHPTDRGRFLFRENVQDLPQGFSIQTQVSALSDKNFLEQYYKPEFDQDVNQETYLYLKEQRDNWAVTALAEARIRRWVDETNKLPELRGYVIGQSFFDRLTYNAQASAGYYQLKPTNVPPPPFDLTTQTDSTGRFDLRQELSFPFYAGPVKVVPYGVLELTEYTSDLNDDAVGRVYGGGGVRASIPFTHLYPDIQSDWFNLNAINHKITLTGNYYFAQSNEPFTRLPQLDRINDDATDQAERDIRPVQPIINPANGVFLATSPLFNPQTYAIRRLVDNRIDTLDSIEVVQADLFQRWQTKRGYPGQQHNVDWMTLDLSASYFPRANQDNFGENLAFLEYNWLWNVGDRNGFVSNGWFDPIDGGARDFNIGAFFNRIDRTSMYLGYRQIDPLNSKLVVGSVSYMFSPKYSMSASAAYDLGTNQNISTMVLFTRTGSDLQVSLGFTYNALQNNFGFLFEILPNVVAQVHHNSALQGIGQGGSGLFGR